MGQDLNFERSLRQIKNWKSMNKDAYDKTQSLLKLFTTKDLKKQLCGLVKYTAGTNPRAFISCQEDILYVAMPKKAYFDSER